MTGATRLRAAGCLLLLAGCANDRGGWVKAGADSGAAEVAYNDCRGLSDTAVETDRAIDQDILASRQNDLQRASAVRTQTQIMHEQTSDRATAIVDSCMKAKGYLRSR